MSPIDPRQLGAPTNGSAISEDRSCPNCNYNLIGLKVGDRCPECGQPITGKHGHIRFANDLTQAPVHYLKRLAMGAKLMVVGIMLVPLASLSLFFQYLLAAAVTLVIAASCWLAGVRIITAPRVFSRPVTFDPQKEWARLRIVNRAIQSSWLLGAVLSLQLVFLPNPIAVVGMLVFFMIGFLSFIPLSVQIADLATWGQHSGLRDRIRASAWGVSFGGAIIILAVMTYANLGGLGKVITFFALLVFAATVACLLMFIVSIMQLAILCGWAVRNSYHQLSVDRRAADRLRAQGQKLVTAQDPNSSAGARPMDARAARARELIKDPFLIMPLEDEPHPYDMDAAHPDDPANPTD